MRRITAFAGALLCLFSIAGLSPVMAAKLHPRCNIDWPCAGPVKNTFYNKSEGLRKNQNTREARRITRADRFRNVEFGSPMYPPETERSFLRGVSTPARFVGAV